MVVLLIGERAVQQTYARKQEGKDGAGTAGRILARGGLEGKKRITALIMSVCALLSRTPLLNIHILSNARVYVVGSRLYN